MRDKAHRWLGLLTSFRSLQDQIKVYLLIGEAHIEALQGEMEKAVSILRKIPIDKEIVREPEADMFSIRFAKEIQEHARH